MFPAFGSTVAEQRQLAPAVLAAVALVLALTAGCASSKQRVDTGAGAAVADAGDGSGPMDSEDDEFADEELDEGDPFEGFNRRMFAFNDRLDELFLAPVARGYRKVVPGAVQRSVRNFMSNLYEPTNIINAALQGKADQAANDTSRFVVNTTVGVLGLFDVATRIGLPRHDEDFGQTFAVWGMPSGPYLVLPFLGPSNVRDGIGLLPYYYGTDLRFYPDDFGVRLALTAIDVVDARARLLGASKVLQFQLDPYIFTRESYRQQRRNKIHDGNPPLEE